MSVEEKNKILVRRLIEEVYNRGNLNLVDELLAPDFVVRDALTGEEAGREDVKRAIAQQATTSSDLRFSIEEQIAEGDKVVTRNIGSGTHDLAEYEGLSPTGGRTTIENVGIDRVVDGKIVESRIVSDSSPWWQQRMDQARVERERVEQELRVARRIQQASLPDEEASLEASLMEELYSFVGEGWEREDDITLLTLRRSASPS